MKPLITIVERGRGPQLSSSRITVQDLLPYLQQRWSYAQVRELMPVLTVDEFRVIERYVADNYEAVVAQERRIRERNANRPLDPGIEETLRRGGEKMDALRAQFEREKSTQRERNRDLTRG